MSHDFKGNTAFYLRSGDNLGREWEITVCSSASANDGQIPYGLSVVSVDTIAYDKDNSDVTSDLVDGTPSVTNNIISGNIKYPTTNGVGRYKLSFLLTLSNGKQKRVEFDTIFAK